MISDLTNISSEESSSDIDYDNTLFDTLMLGGFHLGDIEREVQENCLGYIAGFVVKTIENKTDCIDCQKSLFAEYDGAHHSASNLVFLKQRGGLVLPSSDVVTVVITANDVIDSYVKLNGIKIDPSFDGKLIDKVMNLCNVSKLFPYLNDNFESIQHKQNLILSICKSFIKIKKFSLIRLQNDKKKSDLKKRLSHIVKYC